MKKIALILLLLNLSLVFAATTKKSIKIKDKSTDKIYTVENNPPQIQIGEHQASSLVDKPASRPSDLWYLALIRSSLNYHLPSVTAASLAFSPSLVGVIVGKKTADHFFLYKGSFEIDGEWQAFKREALIGNSSYSQKLNLYQVNLFQNFNIAWAMSHSLFFTAGVGIAPVFLTTEQSLFGNSTSELGYMGMLKGDVIYPLKKNYEIDLAVKMGWGTVGSHELSTIGFSLGLNFE